MDDAAAPTLESRYDEIFRFVRRQTRSDAEAEEITQSVFAQAAAALEREKDGAPRSLAWLYTVAQRRLIDAARRRTTRGVVLPLEEVRREAPARVRNGGRGRTSEGARGAAALAT